MKPQTYSKKSLHYRLAHVYAKCYEWDLQYMNICEYTRKVLFGFFLAILLSFVVGGVLGGFTDFLIWFYVALTTGQYVELHSVGIFGVSIVVGSLVLVGSAMLKDKYHSYKRHKVIHEQPKPPSFIAEAYRSFKDKVCFKVNFE